MPSTPSLPGPWGSHSSSFLQHLVTTLISSFCECLESPREEPTGVGEKRILLLRVSYSMAVRTVAGPSVAAVLASTLWYLGLATLNRKSASSATQS